MIPILKLSELTETRLARLLRRSEIDIDAALAVAQSVIDRVKAEGDAGVLHYARTFDYPEATLESLRVTEKEFEQAEAQLEPELRRAVEHSLRNIQAVHAKQMPPPIHLAEIEPGVLAGEKITPIPRVGLYVPRGKGAFPSMMLMLAAPARVAGVKSIAVCTPPDRQGQVEPVSLVAARLAGVTEIYKLGGVQALAALGLGTGLVPKVDKLIGPCSAYGAAAKRILFGSVDVGLPAGPSESIILADETADPRLAALDLLIEAEHGSDSAALLVTHSWDLAQAAQGHVETYLQQLPPRRRQFCEEGLANYGGILLTPDLNASLDFINTYAPEHLQLLVADPLALLGKIDNAGEILLGAHTPSSAATYAIGVNAVLPTGGFARSYSAVSVFDFLKRSTVAYLTPEGFNGVKDTVTALADYEDFPAHALAIRERERLWGIEKA
ncbi:MAG: histidinol dehydrogenase [Cyanobacteriota bacterium]|nr:histidinol dehydrogenase [Cyanobacteriota bacterium]